MDLSESRALVPAPARPAAVFSPHPILLGRERELVYAAFLPNETLLAYLRRAGLLERMGRQPFVLSLDGRRVPRTLWAHCRPKPGTLINLYAIVQGGDDGEKNPLAVIGMIAVSIFAPWAAGQIFGAGTFGAYAGTAFFAIGGAMIVNALFPPPGRDLSNAQKLGGADSPTYSIGGGSNRMRRYEPFPKIVGVHRVFPDVGAQPYSEFEGEEQVGFYVFSLGYNDAELSDFKIGDTPIANFEGVELEVSGADGKLKLFPGNVDSQAGVELTNALGFVQRTASPNGVSHAIEIAGSLFFLANEGTAERAAEIDMEYRAVGAGAWSPLAFAPDTVPATSIATGVARVPLAFYNVGVRKAITAQPVIDGVTVLSVSVTTPAGDGELQAVNSADITAGGRVRYKSPGGSFGALVRVDGGGQFILYDQARTSNVLIAVDWEVFRFSNAGPPLFGLDNFTVGAEIAGRFMLLNSSRQPVRRSFRWHTAQGQYEVRVRKITPDETNERAVAQIVWSQLRTYQPDATDYTGQLRVAVKIRASALANGTLQQLSCVARARTRVFVPLNTVTGGYESSSWQVGVTPANYTLNQSQAGESVFAERIGPFATTEVVNVCINKDVFAGEPGADGGWNTSTGIAVDRTKSHLFAVFMKRKVAGGTGYWGMFSNGATHAVVVAGGDGNNPYFAADAPANLMPNNDAWYLVVGFVHANGYAGGDLGISGVYNSAGTRVYDGTEFAWAANTTLAAHRSYHYYNSTDPVDTECQQMTRPVIIPCTATEAPGVITALLNKGEIATAPEWPIRHTSNPAWWLLDALRGKTVNGLRVYGAGLADARIDIDGLKAFGAFCDSTGQTINAVFDQQMSVHNLLNAIALMGRGTHSLGTGKHGVLWDAPGLPVTAVFGMHNIVAGSFEIDYSTGDLAEVFEGWFFDAEKEQRDFVRCFVPGAAGTSRTKRLELFGRTSRQLAIEDTNLYAAANAYRARRYKWRADWEMQPVPRGDVVLLGHDLLGMLSGRFIEGGSAASLKLSKKVPLYAEGGNVTIRKPDGTFATYAVQGGAGETDTLVPNAALPFNPWADADGYPPYDYRWHYGQTSTTGRMVKIEALKPVSERYVDVSAVDENPLYYAAKNNPPAVIPPFTLVGAIQLNSVSVTEDGVRAGTGYLARVFVTWDVTGDYHHADVRASVNGGPTSTFAQDVRGRSYAFTVADFSDVVVEVIAWTSAGRLGKSARLTVAHKVNYAGQSRPSNITNYSIEGTTFRWSAPPEVDVTGYIIRFHYGENRSVEDAERLHQGQLSASPAIFPELPAGVVTFMITAIDAAKLESALPAVIVKDLGDPATDNIVEEVDFKALSWPGTLTGGTEVGGNLEADDLTDFYGSEDAPFYGADGGPFYEDSFFAAMRYETEMFYFPSEWAGSRISLLHSFQGEGVRIEYRTTNSEAFYGADDDPFYGADGDPFYGEDGTWQPWTGSIVYENGDLQLAVSTDSSGVQGIVFELTAMIDVPDIEETIQDVVTVPGGTRVVLSKPFKLIKAVQVTVQDDGGAAVSARVLDKSDIALGPLVEGLDGAQASVAALVDVTVKGR